MIELASRTTATVLFLGLGSTFLVGLAASGVTLSTAYLMNKKHMRAETILHNQELIQRQIQRIQGNSTSQSTDSSDNPPILVIVKRHRLILKIFLYH